MGCTEDASAPTVPTSEGTEAVAATAEGAGDGVKEATEAA